jgi:hypothetical protein
MSCEKGTALVYRLSGATGMQPSQEEAFKRQSATLVGNCQQRLSHPPVNFFFENHGDCACLCARTVGKESSPGYTTSVEPEGFKRGRQLECVSHIR